MTSRYEQEARALREANNAAPTHNHHSSAQALAGNIRIFIFKYGTSNKCSLGGITHCTQLRWVLGNREINKTTHLRILQDCDDKLILAFTALQERLNIEMQKRQQAEASSQEKERQNSMLSVDYRQLQQQLHKLEGEYRQECEKVTFLKL